MPALWLWQRTAMNAAWACGETVGQRQTGVTERRKQIAGSRSADYTPGVQGAFPRSVFGRASPTSAPCGPVFGRRQVRAQFFGDGWMRLLEEDRIALR